MVMVTKRRQSFGRKDKRIDTYSGSGLEEERGCIIFARAEASEDIGFSDIIEANDWCEVAAWVWEGAGGWTLWLRLL
jgi:hypothetical protein